MGQNAIALSNILTFDFSLNFQRFDDIFLFYFCQLYDIFETKWSHIGLVLLLARDNFKTDFIL